MDKSHLSIAFSVLSLLLVALTHAASLPEAARPRAKRQSADVRTAEYLAWIALGGDLRSRGCQKVACGVVDVYSRIRRSSADQRVAELQALFALAQGRSRGSYRVAHGQFDPNAIGKKKRDFNTEQLAGGVNEDQRYNILKALIAKAAMGTNDA